MAFGHWPPGFHALLAVWFMVTQPTPAAASLLIGLMAGLLATVLAIRLRPVVRPALATVLAVGFLTAAPVRTELAMVMIELPLTLFCTLAVFAFVDFLSSGRPRHAVWFGVWAITALLTKGNGLALGLLPP